MCGRCYKTSFGCRDFSNTWHMRLMRSTFWCIRTCNIIFSGTTLWYLHASDSITTVENRFTWSFHTRLKRLIWPIFENRFNFIKQPETIQSRFEVKSGLRGQLKFLRNKKFHLRKYFLRKFREFVQTILSCREKIFIFIARLEHRYRFFLFYVKTQKGIFLRQAAFMSSPMDSIKRRVFTLMWKMLFSVPSLAWWWGLWTLR